MLYDPTGHATGLAPVDGQYCPATAVQAGVGGGTLQLARPVVLVVVPAGHVVHAVDPTVAV
jgi:hypothetical protein